MNSNNIKTPKHIAVIMDGNGRWAKSKGKERIYGHNNASRAIRETIEACVELKIKYLSLFTFSTENWNRPKLEIVALIKLIQTVMKQELDNLIKNNIQLKIIGDTSKFSKNTNYVFQIATNKTKKNSGLKLILAINYSGKWDIINALKNIINNDTSLKQIENNFREKLSTNNMPDPELVIRTGGEKRISNFFLWQIAYSEFIFSNIFWPDFRKKDIISAIFEFKKRKRRFGGL